MVLSFKKPGLNQDLKRYLRSLSKDSNSEFSFIKFNKSSLKLTIIDMPFGAIFNLLNNSRLFPSVTLNNLFLFFSLLDFLNSLIALSISSKSGLYLLLISRKNLSLFSGLKSW